MENGSLLLSNVQGNMTSPISNISSQLPTIQSCLSEIQNIVSELLEPLNQQEITSGKIHFHVVINKKIISYERIILELGQSFNTNKRIIIKILRDIISRIIQENSFNSFLKFDLDLFVKTSLNQYHWINLEKIFNLDGSEVKTQFVKNFNQAEDFSKSHKSRYLDESRPMPIDENTGKFACFFNKL